MDRRTERRRGDRGIARRLGYLIDAEQLRDGDATAEVVPAPFLTAPVRVPYELIVLHDHALVIGTSPARGEGVSEP
jgi:hypothetical protein